MRRRRQGAVAFCLGLVTLLVVSGTAGNQGAVSAAEADAGVSLAAAAPAAKPLTQGPPQALPAPRPRPNIVLVLMDDFSMDLLQTMRSARTMKRRGASYANAFVVDSLCCVSRSSTFTGQLPHQTGVLTNSSGQGAGSETGPLGGWRAFADHGNPERTFSVALQGSGYTTGFIGKYLNEYEWVPGRTVPPAPPGWSEFNVVFGSAYDGWGFASTRLVDGRVQVRAHDAPPASAPAKVKDRAYAGSVISRSALRFIRRHEKDSAPYFLEVAPYAPHNRTQKQPYYPGDPVFPPMFRDRPHDGKPGNCGRVACTNLTVRDLPGFGDDRRDNRPRTARGKRARAWNTRPNPFRPAVSVKDLRDRAMMVQSVDRMVRTILRTVGDNTYVVLTSDNGFHLGQNGLGRGKGTAYDTDVHVPLLVVGPGVARGRRAEMTSNIDLAPTFEELAGLSPQRYRFGRSLVPTLTEKKLVQRRYVFFEHTQQSLTRADPDSAFTGDELDRVPSYVAVRGAKALLVRYDLDPSPKQTSYGYEFYSYRHRSWEKKNTFAQKRHADQVATLMSKLDGWDACAQLRGGAAVPASCRRLTR